MWKLIRLSVAYHLKPLLLAWALALLFSKFGLAILAGVAVILVAAEDKERRLLLLMPMPLTRSRISWARVVFPAVSVLVGLAGVSLIAFVMAWVFSSAGSVTSFGTAIVEAARGQLFPAAMMLFFSQFLLTLGELNVWGSRRGATRLLEAFVILLAILGTTFMVWMLTATTGSNEAVSLGTLLLSLGLMATTAHLFQQRTSFTGS